MIHFDSCNFANFANFAVVDSPHAPEAGSRRIAACLAACAAKLAKCVSHPFAITNVSDPRMSNYIELYFNDAAAYPNTELLIETIRRTPPFPRLDRLDLLVSALCPASTEANFASKAWDCAKASAHDGDTDIIYIYRHHTTSYDIKDAVYPLVN